MSQNSEDQAQAQLSNIIAMVAALNVDYDRLEELRNMDDEGGLIPADALELAELEEAANGNDSEEEAREAIQNDALSVDVRSDWHSVGDDSSASEYRILLCTGGPAVQITGNLNRHNEPESATIEHQDWYESWGSINISSDEQAAVIEYARQFWFGE